MDIMDYERPLEPYSENENPEQWCLVLDWEIQRGEKLERKLIELNNILKQIIYPKKHPAYYRYQDAIDIAEQGFIPSLTDEP